MQSVVSPVSAEWKWRRSEQDWGRSELEVGLGVKRLQVEKEEVKVVDPGVNWEYWTQE